MLTRYSERVLALVLLGLVAGSVVYCVLTVIAAENYRASRPAPADDLPPMSVLKPLAGVDLDLEENLLSFFEQKYPRFELLFAVRSPDDPAIPVVERLRERFTGIASRLIITGEPPYPNAKVFSLERMSAAARYDLLVMADSDVRAAPDLLVTFAAEFQNPNTGLLTCPYRAVPGPSFWSKLEAIGLNTEFLGGVLVARLLDGMRFALGPTIAARRQTLVDVGGFHVLKDYLAEDFVMGKLAAELGWGVILSSCVIEHHIGSQAFGPNVRHRLRWNRSTRRSRPLGYIGQLFTNPLPLAALFCLAVPAWWPVFLITAMFRALAARATASRILNDRLTREQWWLVPVQDAASFVFWLTAFFGNTILWRGRKYRLQPDGRFDLVS